MRPVPAEVGRNSKSAAVDNLAIFAQPHLGPFPSQKHAEDFRCLDLGLSSRGFRELDNRRYQPRSRSLGMLMEQLGLQSLEEISRYMREGRWKNE